MLGLLEGNGSGADLLLQQIFYFVLLMGAHGFLRDLGVVRLGPKIFGVFGIAADFQRNEMILFVVCELGIAVAVLGDAFFFQVVGVIGGRADGGGPVGDADGLVNVGLGYVWIGGAGSELGIGVEVFGAGFGGSDGGFEVQRARGGDVGGASGEEECGGGQEEAAEYFSCFRDARTAGTARSCGDTSTGVGAVQGEGRRRGGAGWVRCEQRFNTEGTEKYGEKSETATAFTAETQSAQRKAEKNLSNSVPGPMSRNRPLQIQRQEQRRAHFDEAEPAATNSKAKSTACPVPLRGTGRYKIKCQEPARRRRYDRVQRCGGRGFGARERAIYFAGRGQTKTIWEMVGRSRNSARRRRGAWLASSWPRCASWPALRATE